MSDQLLAETKRLYERVRAIYDKTGYGKSYPLNPWWAEQNMRDMLGILRDSKNAADAIQSVQKTWMFSVNTPHPVKEKAIDWLLREQTSRGLDLFSLPANIQESEFSNRDNCTFRRGRALTPDFIRTVNIVHEIRRHVPLPQGRLRVFELGAGCGHLARTLRLVMQDVCHVIVDIPESLCFSRMFLRLNFPEAKTLYVDDASQLQGEISDYDYVFVPTLFAESLIRHRFDLFLNTASLGEMKNSVIRHWMDFIQTKLQVRYLFTLNRFLNTVAREQFAWRADENECSVLYDADWRVLKWELEPSFTRCPYVDGVVARYLQLVLERTSGGDQGERKELAEALLKDVKDEDWFRLQGSLETEQSCREHSLVPDLTMTGALFKLWESIRLDPNSENVGAMLRYLDHLLRLRDREFEEIFYYEQLFERLLGASASADVAMIKNRVDAKRKARSEIVREEFFETLPFGEPFNPVLVQENYQGFNLVKYRGAFYAFAQELGPVEFTEERLAMYQRINKSVSALTIAETRQLVDALVASRTRPDRERWRWLARDASE